MKLRWIWFVFVLWLLGLLMSAAAVAAQDDPSATIGATTGMAVKFLKDGPLASAADVQRVKIQRMTFKK